MNLFSYESFRKKLFNVQVVSAIGSSQCTVKFVGSNPFRRLIPSLLRVLLLCMVTFSINIFLWGDFWFLYDKLFSSTHITPVSKVGNTSFISYRLLPFIFTPSAWFFHFLFVYLVFSLFLIAFVLLIAKCLRDR